MDPENPSATPAPAPGADPTPAPADPATPPKPTPGEGTGDQPTPSEPGDGGADPTPKPPEDGGDDPGKTPEPGDGDEPPADPVDDPNKPPEDGGEPENQAPDLKNMTRAERAAYFQNLESKTRKDIEARVDEVYQPEAVDDLKQKYLDKGHTEFEASMLAREEQREQELDIAKARGERAELNSTLAIESTEVMATIDWLNPQKKDAYDKKSSDAAIQLYDELCITRDDNTNIVGPDDKQIPGTGQIIGASMTPKQFYGLMDTIRSSGVETATLAGQKAAEEQMAAVAAPSSNSNKREPSFDSLSNAEKRARLIADGHIIT
jgi:hypothetical protein